MVTIGKHSLDSDHTRQRTERRSDFESGKQSDFIVFQQPIPTISRLGLVGRGRACWSESDFSWTDLQVAPGTVPERHRRAQRSGELEMLGCHGRVVQVGSVGLAESPAGRNAGPILIDLLILLN